MQEELLAIGVGWGVGSGAGFGGAGLSLAPAGSRLAGHSTSALGLASGLQVEMLAVGCELLWAG